MRFCAENFLPPLRRNTTGGTHLDRDRVSSRLRVEVGDARLAREAQLLSRLDVRDHIVALSVESTRRSLSQSNESETETLLSDMTRR